MKIEKLYKTVQDDIANRLRYSSIVQHELLISVHKQFDWNKMSNLKNSTFTPINDNAYENQGNI